MSGLVLASPTHPPSADRPPRAFRLLAAIGIGVTLSSIDGAVIATALPAIVQAIEATSATPWIAGAYFIGAVLVTPVSGSLGDAIGHRSILIGGLTLLAAATLACAAAGSGGWLVVARLAQGMAAGAVLNAANVLIVEIFPDGRRARVVGWMTIVFTLATLIAPLLGSLVAGGAMLVIGSITIAGWRLLFLAQLPLIIAAALLASVGHHPKKLENGNWRSGISRIFPPLKLREPVLNRAAFASMASMATLVYLSIGIPVLTNAFPERPSIESGLLLTALYAGVSLGSISTGSWLARGRAIWPALVLPLLLAMAMLALMALGRTISAGALLIFGIGLGPLQAACGLIAQDAVPVAAIGTATAFVQLSRRIGGALGALLAGYLVGGVVDGSMGEIAVTTALFPAAGLLLVALVASAGLPRRLRLRGSHV